MPSSLSTTHSYPVCNLGISVSIVAYELYQHAARAKTRALQEQEPGSAGAGPSGVGSSPAGSPAANPQEPCTQADLESFFAALFQARGAAGCPVCWGA
jgi:hypothetical protein